uniref:Serpentine receptor class gamma n=2 Tax=Caenorhabditis japonica TaxID=281687 RepID=A0A8R1DJA1_CAEJA
MVVSFYTSCYVSKKIKSINLTDRSDVGKKLTRIAMTYTTVYSGILMWSNLSMVNSYLNFIPEVILKFYIPSMTFASDMMTFSLPYILIIFDTNIRKFVFRNKFPLFGTAKVSSSVKFTITTQL